MIVLGVIVAVIGALIGNDLVLKLGIGLAIIGLLFWLF